MMVPEYFTLSNNIKVPSLGFGTFRLGKDDEEVRAKVILAISSGYRHIDTATAYHFEGAVGQGIKDSGLPREEIFLTGKVWNTDQGYESTLAAFEKSLRLLQTDYLDLYLIHWPVWENHENDYAEYNYQTWRALEKLYAEKKIKAIGVSNFLQRHLEKLFLRTQIKPMVNQLEITPFFHQDDIVTFCQKNNIVVESWAPFKHGEVFTSDVLKNIALKYNKSIAQICLQWCLQRNILPIGKASSKEKMFDNLSVGNFNLEESDMKSITTLDDKAGHYAYDLYKLQQAY
ncbi:oxidoreductase [Spirochaetia bacterium]|nr:oxidoreductase [Spirochaetia bacterium]